MYFKRIEIHGFKSFAEPVVIEFDRGITCVVGPNGSGKSNICDAIRWVLGAQSAKMLRGDKMEDVIFAGTANRKSRGMAEVTLVIDNSEGELPIDYNEVAITRRMYRSGESEYLINNNQCRMKDIRELIMDTGIGVEGYSIIGQGKISDIISNNTESIREILEETAGIVMYRSKKADAERKLNSATTNMERVGDIVGEIEGRIDGLRSDSERATEYLTLRDRHRELEINITLKNIENIELKNEYIKDDLINLKIQIDDTKEKRDCLCENINKANQRREALDELIEESRNKQLAVIEEINGLVNQGELKNQRLEDIERDNNRLVGEIKELEEKLNKEKESSEELFKNKRRWDKELEMLSDQLEEKVDKYSEASAKLVEKADIIDENKNQLFNLQGTISSKKAEMKSMETLKETLDRRRNSVVAEKDTGQNANRNSVDSMSFAEKGKKTISQELETLKKLKIDFRENYNSNQKKEKDLAQKLEELKINTGKLSSRKKTMEEMESNYEGFNNAVKFIMKSGLLGINGVVAELIDVPTGYEVAMETALGGTIQNIVCENDSVAKNAIKELKINRAGRLTFLPADSIRAREVKRETGVATAAGFKGYGVDCIKYDLKFKKVVDYLLGNVIVMDNMNNATALSKRLGRGYKFVTLEGEIINTGGAITGGRHRNNSANILERKSEIVKLGEKLEEMLAEQERGAETITFVRDNMEKALESITDKDEEIRKKEREFFAKENEITIIRNILSDFENNAERWKRELKNIDSEQKTSDNTVRILKKEIEDAEKAVVRIKKETNRELELYEIDKEKLEEASTEITNARIKVVSCENEKGKVDAIVDKVDESIAGFNSDKKKKEDTLAAQKKEKEDILENYNDNESEVLEKQKIKERSTSYLKELSEEKIEIIRRLEENGKIREKVDETALTLANQKNELDIKQARQDTQLENAKNKLWEEFEVSYVQAMDFRKKDFVMAAAVKENRDIKNRIKELGEVNVGAIEEYKSVSERYEFLTGQRDDIVTSMKELKQIIEDMDKIIRSRFKESFDKVVENFEEVFRELYGGGHAKITLADENNPFDSEIEINAQPPGKQLKHINLLSGGEKTMTAIALMFAVLRTKPTPCCILDEIEAALDDRNLDIFGEYIRKFEGVQFTLITHQKSTMEHADVMYGITMPESGISKVYSLKMGDDPAV